MKKILFAISLGTLLLGGHALGQGAPQTVKICIPTSGTTCPPVTASAPLPVTGSFAATLSGFTPNGNYGTLTATAATSASTAMPAGTSVAFQNTSTVDVSCVLSSGAATATTNKTIVRGGSTVFLTVGSNTNAACINQTGSASNVIVMAGGTGLGTNFGGGSGGGGGGGAVTMASGAVASGAYSSGSIASGAYASGSIGSGAMVDLGAIADAASTAGGTGSVNAKLRLMTTQLGTINTTLGSPFQAGGSIGNTSFGATQSGTWTVQPGNTANTTPWLASISQGGNTAAVKAASTAPAASDPAAVVALSPNGKTGFEFEVANTPTVQNAAYSAGNAIGGKQSLSVFRSSGSSGVLNNISVWSKGGSTVAMTLYIFNADPSSSTCTDKSAFVLNAADVAKLVAMTPPVLTPGVIGSGTTATAASQQLPVNVVNGDSTQNLYVCAVMNATVTPASTTDLVFKLSGVAD